MIIYKITNVITQKVYIGLTQYTLEFRKSSHKRSINSKGNRPLYSSMKKHGFCNFKFEELYCSRDFEHLCEMEKFFIKVYDSTNMQKGYNLAQGGRVNYPSEKGIERIRIASKELWANPKHRELVIPKLKLAAQNRKICKIDHLFTAEAREKAKTNRAGKYTGTDNHNYGKIGIMSGKKFTLEHRLKIKQSLLGNSNGKSGKEHPNAKKVQCVETGEIFECVADAKRLHKGNIYKAATNGTTADNKHWRYILD